MNIDTAFDEKFYLFMYPDAKNFVSDNIDMSEKERAYLHYKQFGQHLGCFINWTSFEEYKLFKCNFDVPEDFDEHEYAKNISNIEQFFQPYCTDHSISDRKRIYYHYITYHEKSSPIRYIDKILLKQINNSILIYSDKINWQSFISTEKKYYDLHTNLISSSEDMYVGFPWCSLIDPHIEPKAKFSQKTLQHIKYNLSLCSGKKHTVSQSIYWKQLIPIWKEIGITDVHLAHYENNIKNSKNLTFHSWPLIAFNQETSFFSDGLEIKNIDNKKYLASFIGGYEPYNYRNNIRLKLESILKPEYNTVYKLSNGWFFNLLVNNDWITNNDTKHNTINKYKLETFEYNSVLSDSIFSICPDGSGPNSLRLWESMSVGAIPVIISDSWIPPKVDNIDWANFAIFIKSSDINNLIPVLKNYSKESLQTMQTHCLNAYMKFKNMTCFN